MFNTILGWLWILLGCLWLAKPEWLRARLGRKTGRRIRWMLIPLFVFLVFNFIGLAVQVQGLLSKCVAVLGVCFLLRFVFRLQSKGLTQLLEWWSGLPLIIFRLVALSSIAAGVALLYR